MLESAKSSRCVLIGGTHAGGNGYPNAWHTIQLLSRQLGMHTVECGVWLSRDTSLWRIATGNKWSLVCRGLALVMRNLASVGRTLFQMRHRACLVYVPYPAVFYLWWMSWIPRPLRPMIVADAYISVWDAWVCDRHLNGTNSWFGRCLQRFEGRALQTADFVLTDTVANRLYYKKAFDLRIKQVLALPLAIDETRFLDVPLRPPNPQIRTVLFIGTMIPLHGIETILEAIRLLPHESSVRYRLVGDGQLGGLVSNFIETAARPDVEWIREWQDPDSLVREISAADICLGIFGGTAKSTRVLPFKAYMYLAGGRATVTQEEYALPDNVPPPPWVTVPAQDSKALAEAIKDLLRDGPRRSRLGAEARAYFQQHLGSAALAARWRALLAESWSHDR